VVSRLERRYTDFPGLNLTLHTLEGILRHTTAFDRPVIPYPVRECAPELVDRGLSCIGTGPSSSVECQIVNVADQIAWVTHDVEDAIRVRFLHAEDLLAFRNPLVQAAVERIAPASHSDDSVLWTRLLIRNMIDLLISDVVAASRRLLEGADSADEVRARPGASVAFSESIGGAVDGMREFLLGRVYTHPIVERMSLKADRILSRIFETLTEDILERGSKSIRLLPLSTRHRLEGAGHPVGRILVVADFLAGMTDRFASEFYRVLFQPDERSITSLY